MSRPSRLDSIDLLRGLVMAVMVLDHTRDYVHTAVDPTDLAQTTTALFLTRWVTHFCAPVFVFLAGTAMSLQLQRGASPAEVSRFLLTRGLWLIFLEITIVRWVQFFSLDLHVFGLAQVIWAIGVSMVALAGLIHLPWRWVLAIGVAMIVGHNALDAFRVADWAATSASPPTLGAKLWMVIHQGGSFPITGADGPIVYLLYPIVPWIGVMAVGLVFGRLYALEPAARRRWIVRIGLALTAAFLALRASNLYGDPMPWSSQRTPLFTVLSFLDCQKYPPSLLFLLMTLGPALLALAWFDAGGDAPRGPLGRALVTLGRVPLFFYILQWFVAHALAWLLFRICGLPSEWLLGFELLDGPPQGTGFGLATVYALWLTALVLLYPACAWFARVKATHRTWWLRYL